MNLEAHQACFPSGSPRNFHFGTALIQTPKFDVPNPIQKSFKCILQADDLFLPQIE